MLPKRHRQHYEEIGQRVDQLQKIATCRLDIVEFQAIFLRLEAESSLTDEGEALGVKVQSYQTEINKQLRLLKIDLMFLQTARQSTTSQQRWAMIGDRLHLLALYCDALLSQDF